jgi:uncharacterized protein (TIGR02391 family)
VSKLDEIKDQILFDLREDFAAKKFSAASLKDDYEGVAMAQLRQAHELSPVEFDLALAELENSSMVGTGPRVAHKNKPGSGLFIFATYSERKYAYLKEAGYKAALKLNGGGLTKKAAPKPPIPNAEIHFYGIHPTIIKKCGPLYEATAYAEAVEKSFKIVRDRLRELTGYETGSDAFGNGQLHIHGAAAEHVSKDFNQAVKFLTMAIDMFRNEKAHTVDGNIFEPTRAHQYLSLSSLALSLLENATGKKAKPKSG